MVQWARGYAVRAAPWIGGPLSPLPSAAGRHARPATSVARAARFNAPPSCRASGGSTRRSRTTRGLGFELLAGLIDVGRLDLTRPAGAAAVRTATGSVERVPACQTSLRDHRLSSLLAERMFSLRARNVGAWSRLDRVFRPPPRPRGGRHLKRPAGHRARRALACAR
jgi:hypothetical protein